MYVIGPASFDEFFMQIYCYPEVFGTNLLLHCSTKCFERSPYFLSVISAITLQCVGNKAKGRISKRVFQENKARQIFRKTNISDPLVRTRTCAYQGVRNVHFSENLTCFVCLKHPFR